jgi:dipeptidyl-peptidase-4
MRRSNSFYLRNLTVGAALRPVSVAVLLSALALFLPAQQTAGKRDFSYEQVFGTEPETGGDQVSLLGKLPRISGWLDGSTYLETRDGSADGQNQVFAVNAADGSARLFRDYAEIQKSLPDGFKIEDIDATTPDLTRAVLIRDDDLYYLDLVSKSFRRMTTSPGQERNPLFSPDGRWVAYTRDNNLFAYDLEDGVEHQYTTDGNSSVYNGWASWVYYEEIIGRPSHFKAFWWSPDSSQIVFMRFDDSPVP